MGPFLPTKILPEKTWPILIDIGIFAAVIAAFYGVITIAAYWFSAAVPEADISNSPWALPLYTFYSLVRIFAAYVLSLFFAVGYGYVAAYYPRAERILIPILDILQSIPVLSFLPGVMLAMVSLFPTRQVGVELGSILLIFTGQVWNMAFSFYSSLKSIPRELREASTIFGFSPWQRFFSLELPYGTIGLVWNSIVSVAGGWFFLMACEMFVLGKRDFRLPGLGSYLQTAASAGDTRSMLWGLGAMVFVIVTIDQLMWRPILAWADKFKFEQVESSAGQNSPILNLIRRSRMLTHIGQRTTVPLSERLSLHFAKRQAQVRSVNPAKTWPIGAAKAIGLMVVMLGLYGVVRAFLLVITVPRADFIATLIGAGATFLRVNLSLLIAAAWTIPAGVAIGFNPKLARIAQPLAQIAASVPATALFPVILLGLIQFGGGMGMASILLMLLGTQWYVLFNVIAGAMAIPSDLKEVADVFHFSRLERWRVVIIPGIFPYLVTGMVTASGGAWNASIIAEYFRFKDKILSTTGLGAQISSATDSGKFALLLLSTVVMASMVVCINRIVWRPLYGLAQTKYKLES